MSRNGPKPLEGLLRGKEHGSALDSLGLARTMHARYSYRVWWGVMLPEEARAVVGEWCGSVPARLVRVAAPPASRTAAPLRAVDTKSVLSTYSRVLQRLQRITTLCHVTPPHLASPHPISRRTPPHSTASPTPPHLALHPPHPTLHCTTPPYLASPHLAAPAPPCPPSLSIVISSKF